VASSPAARDSLRPGQATAVDLELRQASGRQQAVQVPAGAVLRHEDKQWVFRRLAKAGKATGYRATPVSRRRPGRRCRSRHRPARRPVAGIVTALKASWLGG
jgi:hypothetical protein